DRNRSHWSTSKTPSYTKSVSWQHHPIEAWKVSRTQLKKQTNKLFQSLAELGYNVESKVGQ
ncbi:hypothetical protein PO522_24745, partial [Escherichia coli]|uniref:hypothetical protein n=1 Tax=Escherichia coli TaxID=562 RepID=UPI00102DB5A5